MHAYIYKLYVTKRAAFGCVMCWGGKHTHLYQKRRHVLVPRYCVIIADAAPAPVCAGVAADSPAVGVAAVGFWNEILYLSACQHSMCNIFLCACLQPSALVCIYACMHACLFVRIMAFMYIYMHFSCLLLMHTCMLTPIRVSSKIHCTV